MKSLPISARALPGGWSVLALSLLALLVVGFSHRALGESLILREGENGYTGFKSMRATSQATRYTERMEPMFVGQTGPGSHAYARGFFSFDLAPLLKAAGQGTLKINRVSFTLHKTGGPAVETVLDLRIFGDGGSTYPVNDSGDDVQNWADAPTEPGGTLGTHLVQATNPVENDIPITFDSTVAFVEAVQDALTKGDRVLRLVALWDGDQPGSAPPGERITRFHGAGADEPTHRPTLTIDYTVTP